MNGPSSRSDAPPRGTLRPRLVVWVALPVLILGVSYFLFVEYVLESQGVGVEGVRLALRIGGLALVAIALVLAAACGFLLADRVSRPIRALLRLVESGELPAGRSLFLHHRDWEVFQLYRRVTALVQQNQTGAKALEELESQRSSIEHLRQELQRTGPHGIALPVVLAQPGRLEPILDAMETNRGRLVAFLSELRERVAELCGEIQRAQALEPPVGNGGDRPIDPKVRMGEIRESLVRLRTFGTIWSLEIERSRVDGNVGEMFDRFTQQIEAVEASIDDAVAGWSGIPERGVSTGPVDAMRDSWTTLAEKVGSLVRKLDEVRDR
ncbi:MAG: hypothetical protein KC729_04970 [Candidatus Eisenbacteria bacterium]|uniref:Uncharacterized protein n=1 Tax=Eiseniibacteriota bacterium TaxID=2212470 RepID=A0A956LWV9_UNCEI|nr:hypothetical protein [Candidatus Eisenbacteria bacterium]